MHVKIVQTIYVLYLTACARSASFYLVSGKIRKSWWKIVSPEIIKIPWNKHITWLPVKMKSSRIVSRSILSTRLRPWMTRLARLRAGHLTASWPHLNIKLVKPQTTINRLWNSIKNPRAIIINGHKLRKPAGITFLSLWRAAASLATVGPSAIVARVLIPSFGMLPGSWFGIQRKTVKFGNRTKRANARPLVRPVLKSPEKKTRNPAGWLIRL